LAILIANEAISRGQCSIPQSANGAGKICDSILRPLCVYSVSKCCADGRKLQAITLNITQGYKKAKNKDFALQNTWRVPV
jgi:hypothetical protein